MGTNYYVRVRDGEVCPNPCAHCRHQASPVLLHLGKFSGGWRFLHRAYRKVDDLHGPKGLSFPVTDRESWLKLLDLGTIENEYGSPYDKAEFLAMVESDQHYLSRNSEEAARMGPNDDLSKRLREEYYFTDGPYDFCDAEFC